MANGQVLLSTHLHKHRKGVRSTTMRSATVIWAMYTHSRPSTVQAAAPHDVRFYLGRAYSAARLTVSRAARPAVRVRLTVLSGSTHVVESDGTY